MKQVSLIVADDHPVYRQGLKVILEREPAFVIAGEASDGEAALALARELTPDVLLLDVTMPRLDGIAVARACRDEGLGCGVVLLTMHQDEQLLHLAFRLGVRGYVLKESVADEIVDAVRAVARGGEFLSPPLVRIMMRRARHPTVDGSEVGGLAALTASERRVLRLIASGRTSKEIAGDLGISIRTVENHRAHAAKKLGLSGAHSLVKFAFEHREEL